MENPTEIFQINREITLYTPAETPLTFQGLTLNLTAQENEIQKCCLTLLVSYDIYEKIDQLELFNLKLEARVPLVEGDFLPQRAIALEAALRPDLLPQLAEKAKTAEEIINYLENLGLQPNIAEALNCTENWYGLSVKQQQDSAEIGYRTLWEYANLDTINQVVNAGNQVVQHLAKFIKELAESLMTEVESEGDTASNLPSFLQKSTSEEVAEEIAVSEVMLEFFEEDDWNYVKLEDSGALQMSYQGDSGRWTCYASADDDSQRLIFYSVAPLTTPLEKIPLMAEFVCKANYGLMIGNFELDFNDGELRYKTSIDVENDRLSTALVRNVVYINLETMDSYLPAIVGIINNQLSPDEAIAKIENQTETETAAE